MTAMTRPLLVATGRTEMDDLPAVQHDHRTNVHASILGGLSRADGPHSRLAIALGNALIARSFRCRHVPAADKVRRGRLIVLPVTPAPFHRSALCTLSQAVSAETRPAAGRAGMAANAALRGSQGWTAQAAWSLKAVTGSAAGQ
jgi:hypothetical protein